MVTHFLGKEGITGSNPVSGSWGCSSTGRALGLHPRGHRFKPDQLHSFAFIAQLAEQAALNRKIEGSTPSGSIMIRPDSPTGRGARLKIEMLRVRLPLWVLMQKIA
jgi:hypothetical protein